MQRRMTEFVHLSRLTNLKFRLCGDTPARHHDFTEVGEPEVGSLPPVLAPSALRGAEHGTTKREPQIPHSHNPRHHETRTQQREVLRQGSFRVVANEWIVEMIVVDRGVGDLGRIRLGLAV
jgi:hypothetical protein